MKQLILTAFCLIFIQVSVFAIPREGLKVELESLFATIENHYAPLQYKQETQGLDWEKLKDELRKEVDQVEDLDEYILIVKKLFAELNDIHVSFMTYKDIKTKELPVRFYYIQGKTYLNYINDSDPDRFTSDDKKASISIGMELIEIDGQTPKELRDEINNAVISKGASLSAIQMATQYFGLRSTGSYHPYPKEEWAELKLKDKDGKIVEMQVKWEEIDIKDYPNLKVSNEDKTNDLLGIGKEIEIGKRKPLFKMPSRMIFIPKCNGFTRIAMNNNPFYAGYFKLGERRIGFLRIADYTNGPSYILPGNITSKRIRKCFEALEEKTDALIIDQTNNPGGVDVVAEWILSSLLGGRYNYQSMKFKNKPSLSEINNMKSLIDDLEPLVSEKPKDQKAHSTHPLQDLADILEEYTAEYEQLKSVYESNPYGLSEPTVSTQTKAEILEEAMYTRILTNKQKMQARASYTKPVVVLINELDFSGADYVPAILQDNKRATLIGTTTGGAGGSLSPEPFTSNIIVPFQFALTNSLMLRPNGEYIENNGVQPDIELNYTPEDFRNNFKPYFDKVLEISCKQVDKSFCAL